MNVATTLGLCVRSGGDEMEAGSPGGVGRRCLGLLQRYVVAEFLRALALAAAVFTGFFVLMTLLQFEGDARSYGTDVMTLVGALPYFTPYILCFSLPMAFFVASVLAFGRLEGSGEISAMRAAGGVRQFRLLGRRV